MSATTDIQIADDVRGAHSLHPVVSCTSFNKSKCPAKCEHSRPHEPIRDIYDEGKGYCHHLHGTCGYRSDQPKCICAANGRLVSVWETV